MKKSVLSIMFISLFAVAFSQTENTNSSGVINYEEVIKFEVNVEGLSQEMLNMMPTENRSTKLLTFNEDASRYENSDSEDNSVEKLSETEDGSVKIMISEPDDIIFRDLKKKKIFEQKEFMTRIFLIESDLEVEDWKFTGKQKMILDYPCQQAVLYKEDDTISVWFTPAISVSTGPSVYGNLPGLILSVESDGGDHTIVAKSIELGKIDIKNLQKPKKGKKVSKEKYEAIVKEKTEEMGGESSGGKTIIMKMEYSQ